MPARVEGSAMTLIPNASTTDVADERKFPLVHQHLWREIMNFSLFRNEWASPGNFGTT